MTFIFIDRRKAGRGKSSPNRQKLIRRVKSFIKVAQPQNIGTGGISGNGGVGSSPVRVANSALEEPWFAYANDGENTSIIIGNTEYDRGDEIDIPEDEDGSPGGGPGDKGEDDFVVNVARDEFLDLFFEDCELPNLTNEKYTDKLDNKFQHAGFSTSGNPSQLSIIRTYKQALARRKALSAPHKKEVADLELELEALQKQFPTPTISARVIEIVERLEVLRKKLIIIEGFDRSDLRYRNKEAKPLHTVEAVLIMLMDISGSMDENKKTIARRWFALLYAFIKRRYSSCELVFIAHTDEVFEMSENDFFSTRINGGTTVSPALKMINQIIKERYDPNQTNIYVSHASDGDNWGNDNQVVIEEMAGDGRLTNKIQMFNYVEVGKPNSWMVGLFGQRASSSNSGLWEAYDTARVRNPNPNKISLAILETADDCFPVFKKVFKKEKK
jgi:uncharacterized sporulation protein YeaH/YhbH (DUF444 family)